MNTHTETDLDTLRDALTPKEQQAAELYVSGPKHIRGNRTAAFRDVYPWNGSDAGARAKASELFKREGVSAYVRALRATGTERALALLRDWGELAPQAQELLARAAAGKLPAGMTDEAIRSGVKAAIHILDRALGSVAQQVELRQSGGITVRVAGPETVARVLAASEYQVEDIPPGKVPQAALPAGDAGKG